MQKVTTTGWKQAQQGLKGLTGGPLQVGPFPHLQHTLSIPQCHPLPLLLWCGRGRLQP